MRLSSIWFMPSFSFKERVTRTRDWAANKVASSLPLRIRFWVTMQEIGKATMDSPNIPATKLDDILKNLEEPKVLR